MPCRFNSSSLHLHFVAAEIGKLRSKFGMADCFCDPGYPRQTLCLYNVARAEQNIRRIDARTGNNEYTMPKCAYARCKSLDVIK